MKLVIFIYEACQEDGNELNQARSSKDFFFGIFARSSLAFKKLQQLVYRNTFLKSFVTLPSNMLISVVKAEKQVR